MKLDTIMKDMKDDFKEIESSIIKDNLQIYLSLLIAINNLSVNKNLSFNIFVLNIKEKI